MDFVRPIEAIVPGATGRVLAVFAETTAELNLRTIARLAGVSPAQASRVLPPLVRLGLLDRREVPPSSLFRFVPEHVAARAVLSLGRSSDVVFGEFGQISRSVAVCPVSVIVFGSFARGEADADSDIDVLAVRPVHIDDEDDDWTASIEQWRTEAQRLTGNRIDMLEMGMDEATDRLLCSTPLWTDIRRDGRVVHGLTIDELIDHKHSD